MIGQETREVERKVIAILHSHSAAGLSPVGWVTWALTWAREQLDTILS